MEEQIRNRDSLTAQEKQKNFAAAFDVIAEHRKRGSPLAAYVLAFSVFEDRVTAATMWAADLAKRERPKKYSGLHFRINLLLKDGHISKEEADSWKFLGNERNRLIHGAMWHFDAISDEHVTSCLKIARLADKVARRLGQEVKKNS